MAEKPLVECVRDGHKHTHSTFDELMRCVGGGRLVAHVFPSPGPAKGTASVPASPVSGTVPAAPSVPVMRNPDGVPTDAQLRFIRNLGGSWRDAADTSKAEASQLIELLKDPAMAEVYKPPVPQGSLEDDEWELFPIEREYRQDPWAFCGKWPLRYHFLSDEKALPSRAALPTSAPAVAATGGLVEDDASAVAITTDTTRLVAMIPLLERVESGYYGVEDEFDKVHFIRISRPKSGSYRGTIKVQTIHGEQLKLAWVLTALSKSARSYTYEDIEAWLLKIIIDASGAARRYAREIGRCCRCNARLTDDRSRHYGIGPECEKYWPHIINEVDLEDEMARGI